MVCKWSTSGLWWLGPHVWKNPTFPFCRFLPLLINRLPCAEFARVEYFFGKGWRRFVCLPQHLLDFVRTFNNFWTQNPEQFFESARALWSRIQSNNFSVWGVRHYRSRQGKQGKSLVNKSFPQGSRLLSILLMEKSIHDTIQTTPNGWITVSVTKLFFGRGD